MLIVQYRHDEICRLKQQRCGVGRRVARGNGNYGADAMRAHGVSDGGREGKKLIEIARRHSLEVDDHAGVAAGIHHDAIAPAVTPIASALLPRPRIISG